MLVHGENLESATFSVGSQSLPIIAHCGTTVFVRCPALGSGNHTLKVTCPGGTTTREFVVGSFEGLSCIEIIGCLGKALDDSFSAGCIGNMGVHASLKTKLTQAVENLQSNRGKTALQQVSAFADELEAQSGQGIDAGIADALVRIVREILIPCIEEDAGHVGCKIVCKGGSTDARLQIDETEVFWETEVFSEFKRQNNIQRLKRDFSDTTHDKVEQLRNAANCGGYDYQGVTLDVESALSMSMGVSATFGSVGTGDAFVDAENAKVKFRQTYKRDFITQEPAPLITGGLGHWENTMTCVEEGKENCEAEVFVVAFGAAQGDEAILKEGTKAEVEAIKLLKKLLEQLLKTSPLDKVWPKGTLSLFDYSGKVEADSKSNITITVDGNDLVKGSAKSKQSYERDKDYALKKNERSAEGFCDVQSTTIKKKEVKSYVLGSSSNVEFARGMKIESVCASSNAWGLIILMKCGTLAKVALVYDGIFFDFQNDQGQSDLPRMSEFGAFFDTMGGQIETLRNSEAWQTAQHAQNYDEMKKMLETLAGQLKSTCTNNEQVFESKKYE